MTSHFFPCIIRSCVSTAGTFPEGSLTGTFTGSEPPEADTATIERRTAAMKFLPQAFTGNSRRGNAPQEEKSSLDVFNLSLKDNLLMPDGPRTVGGRLF